MPTETLYLLRHGPAVEPGTPGFADDERPLTADGRKKVRRVARGLARLRLEVDRIVTSPLPRALVTAEIVAEELDVEDLLARDDALLARASAESVRGWLAGRAEGRLMLVGHNPWISELVGLLLTGRADVEVCELAKPGLAVLSRQFDGSWRLEWLARPRLLRKLAD